MYYLPWLIARTGLYKEKLPEEVGATSLDGRGKGRCAVVGERVRQFRTALGMTQEQREATSGVPHGSIVSIAGGIADDVHTSRVIGFAKGLHVSAGYVLGLDKSEEAPSNNHNESLKRAKGSPKAKA